MTRRRPARFAGVILFAMEGPRKPLWLFPAIIGAVGILLIAACLVPRALGPYVFVMAVAAVCIVGFWVTCRMAIYSHYKQLAAEYRPTRCLHCGYSLADLPSRKCPECGRDSDAMASGARKLIASQDDNPTWFNDDR